MATPSQPQEGRRAPDSPKAPRAPGDAARVPRREMPMGARRDALAAARGIRLSPLLSRPDLDTLERGLELLEELAGPRPARAGAEPPLYGPVELKDLSELLPELTRLAAARDPLFLHHLARWRDAGLPHSEMALRLRVGFAGGYLPLDPGAVPGGAAWDAKDLALLEPVITALPMPFKRLGALRVLRLEPLAPDHGELQQIKEHWKSGSEREKAALAGQLVKLKGILSVTVSPEPLPEGIPGAAQALHVPAELLALGRLRGLRGCTALGIVYALAKEHHGIHERERQLFDHKLERVMRRERLADEPARAYALAVTAFAVAPGLLEEKWPKTHAHLLDRFQTSLAAFDGGALLRPAMAALLALR